MAGIFRPALWSGGLLILVVVAAVVGWPQLARATGSLAGREPIAAVEPAPGAAGPSLASIVPLPEPAPSAPPSASLPPARPATLYELAAAQYGVSPRMLEALHGVESSALAGGCLANHEGSGAIGPFQFKPATFRAYGVDADGDGRADICGFADSLFSAARYLKSLGADAEPASPASRNALRRYGTDPERVIALAG